MPRTQGGPQSQSRPPGPPPAASRHAGCLSGRISSGLLYDPRHVCPPFHMPSLRHTLSSLAGPQPYVLAHTWPLSLEHVSVQLKWPQTPCACTRTSSPQGQPPTPFPFFSTPLAQPPAQPPAHSPLFSLRPFPIPCLDATGRGSWHDTGDKPQRRPAPAQHTAPRGRHRPRRLSEGRGRLRPHPIRSCSISSIFSARAITRLMISFSSSVSSSCFLCLSAWPPGWTDQPAWSLKSNLRRDEAGEETQGAVRSSG